MAPASRRSTFHTGTDRPHGVTSMRRATPMTRTLRIFAMLLAVGGPLATRVRAQSDEVPEALAPFEHLVGAWKGAGIPAANKVKGWPESHAWAWAFEGGKPVAMTLTLEGNRAVRSGRLTVDPAGPTYRLDAVDADGKPAVFAGTLDAAGQVLALDREGPLPDGSKQRLTVRLNSNKIRYLLWDDRQAPGSPRYARFIEVNQGKAGESFAAGGAASNLPKCIITGGAASMSVSHAGKSYPICCTGCRDEFEADPEKYIKKLALKAAATPDGTAPAPAAAKAARDDGEFDALVTDKPARAKAAPKAKTATPKGTTTPVASPATPPAGAPAPAAAKAAELLTKARALDTKGDTTAATALYKLVVRQHPGTPQARTAADRLKALGAK